MRGDYKCNPQSLSETEKIQASVEKKKNTIPLLKIIMVKTAVYVRTK